MPLPISTASKIGKLVPPLAGQLNSVQEGEYVPDELGDLKVYLSKQNKGGILAIRTISGKEQMYRMQWYPGAFHVF